MKKNIIIISVILVIIISICLVKIKINTRINIGIRQENKQYEQYLNSEIYGTDVVTLINKAINNNENNNVTKDEKGFYINNKQNSVIIDLVMITDVEKQETTTYRMETIAKVGITEFIKNFNTAKFECTKKEYHTKTGKISYIEMSEKYEQLN